MLIEALLEELEQCLHRLARSTGARAEQYLYSHQVVELVEVAVILVVEIIEIQDQIMDNLIELLIKQLIILDQQQV